MKISTDKVVEIIKSEQVEPAVLRSIVEKINLAVQEGTEEKEPAIKKQFVVLVSDPHGHLSTNNTDFVAWVLQIPEDESPATIQDRINTTAYTYNATRKGRLFPIYTVGEAIESIKAGPWRENAVWVKTKTPILVVRTNNVIPNVEASE